jgi:hypothetical protein
LSGIVFFNFRTGDINFAVQRSAQRTTQAVATAINYTLSGRSHQNTVSSGGYGIHFREGSNTIIIFADCNRNGVYNPTTVAPTTSCRNATGTAPFSETSLEIRLEEQITINRLNPCAGTPCAMTITFTPPVPRARFSPVLGPLNETTITLRHQGGRTTNVTINRLGVTSIQ